MVIDFNFQSSLERVYIIAEIGVNHNGELDLAEKNDPRGKKFGSKCS